MDQQRKEGVAVEVVGGVEEVEKSHLPFVLAFFREDNPVDRARDFLFVIHNMRYRTEDQFP